MIKTLMLKTRLVKIVSLIVAGSMTLSALTLGAFADTKNVALSKIGIVDLLGDLTKFGYVVDTLQVGSSHFDGNWAVNNMIFGDSKPTLDNVIKHNTSKRVIRMEFTTTESEPKEKYFVLYTEDENNTKTYIRTITVKFKDGNKNVSENYEIDSAYDSKELKICQVKEKVDASTFALANFIGDVTTFPAFSNEIMFKTVFVQNSIETTGMSFYDMLNVYYGPGINSSDFSRSNSKQLLYKDQAVSEQGEKGENIKVASFEEAGYSKTYVSDLLETIPTISDVLKNLQSSDDGSFVVIEATASNVNSKNTQINEALENGSVVLLDINLSDLAQNEYFSYAKDCISAGWDQTEKASRLIVNMYNAPQNATVKLSDQTAGTVIAPNVNFEAVTSNHCGAIYSTGTLIINKEIHTTTFGHTYLESFSREFEDTTTKFTFTKTDGTNPLAGAGFTLYDSDNKPIGDEVKSDEKGEVTFKDLEYGKKYYVKETTVPEGYIADTKEYTLTVGADGKCEFSAPNNTIVNKPDSSTTSFSFKKTDDANAALADATFTLTGSDGKSVEATSNASGIVEFSNIKYSKLNETKYTVKETSAPQGYIADTEEYTLTIDVNGKCEFSAPKNTIVNNPDSSTTSFSFTKTDDANAALANAVFTLTGSDGTSTNATSNASGIVEFSNIKYSKLNETKYTVKETSAPQGYIADTKEYTLTIDVNGKCEFSAPNNTIVNKPDSGTTSFSFTKTDGTNALQGAKFTLTGNGTSTNATSNASGVVEFSNIKYSKLNKTTYTVKETSAPQGYIADTKEYTLTIDVDGKCEFSAPNNTIVNKPDSGTTSFSFTKTDGTNALQGATFTLTGNGTSTNATSNASGVVEFSNIKYSKLNKTTYTVKETSAPQGYIADTKEYTLTIDVDGKCEFSAPKNTIVNNPIKLSFSFTKTDGVKAISGVNFTLYSDSQCKNVVGSEKSGSDGVVTFSNLAYDVRTYFLKEATPAGYKTNDTVYTVTFNDKGVATIGMDGTSAIDNNTIINEKIFNIELKKTFEGPTPADLSDVTFGLYEKDGTPVATVAIDNSRTAKFTNETMSIALGKTYYMQEINSAEGYACSDEKFFVKVSLDGIVTYKNASGIYTSTPPTCNNCEKEYGTTSFSFEKTDDKGVALDGAQFGLYANANDTAPSKTAVSTGGKVTFDELDYDEVYYIREINAPKGYSTDKQTYTLTIGKYNEATGKATKTFTDANKKDVTAIKNTPETVTTSFSFVKTDDKNAALAGAEFTLTKPDKTTVTTKSANDGKVSFTGLSYSKIANAVTTYTIKETKAPNGYEANNAEYTLKIDEDGKMTFTYQKNGVTTNVPIAEVGGKNVIVIANTPRTVTTDFSFMKTDNANAALAGAKFTLTGSDGTSTNATSNINGIVEFSDIKYSMLNKTTYTVQETSAPKGYIKDDNKYTLTIDVNGKCTFNAPKNTIVNKPDSSTTSFSFTKTDGTNALKGATFTLTGSDGKSTNATSNINGIVEFSDIKYSKLNITTYTLQETSAPNGYIKDDNKYTLTIDVNGKCEFSAPNNTIVNKPDSGTTSFSFTKTDGTNALKGATFTLTGSDGTSTNATSNINGIVEFSNIKYSMLNKTTYTVQETSAPNGYIKDDNKYTLTIDVNGKCEFSAPNNTIVNKPDNGTTSFSFTKTDGTKPLAGAIFELYDSADSTTAIQKATSATTSGKVTFENISYSEVSGTTYYIEEISAPKGYIADTNRYVVTFGARGEVEETNFPVKNDAYVITNDKIKIDIELIKTFSEDISDELASKTLFGLYSDENCGENSLISQANPQKLSGVWMLKFTNGDTDISVGNTYFLKEISAPEGFDASKVVFYCFVDENGKVTYNTANDKSTAKEDFPICKNVKSPTEESSTTTTTTATTTTTVQETEEVSTTTVLTNDITEEVTTTVTEGGGDEGITIIDESTPLAEIPNTGVKSYIILFALIGGAALVVCGGTTALEIYKKNLNNAKNK